MTERINVTVRTALNRIHAVLALVFWIFLGKNISKHVVDLLKNSVLIRLSSEKIDDIGIGIIIIGIIIGIVRLFVINDRYAWQVATIEYIKDLEDMLEKRESEKNNISSENTDFWVCLHCGESNPAGTRFCKKCGK